MTWRNYAIIQTYLTVLSTIMPCKTKLALKLSGRFSGWCVGRVDMVEVADRADMPDMVDVVWLAIVKAPSFQHSILSIIMDVGK